MTRRILPKSLLGQMVLAVAVALLVAQVLAGVLIYRAEWQRREAGLVSALAFQLVAASERDPRETGPDDDREAGEPFDRRGPPRRRRGSRIERLMQSPIMADERHEERREKALAQLLEEHDVDVEALVVVSRPVSSDRFMLERLRDRPSLRGSTEWDLDGKVLIAGLKRAEDPEWLVARVPMPDDGRSGLVRTLLQTLVLYVVLVGGLAILLQRITRPLAALTARVDRFAGRLETDDPLEPSGPEDTRRLIAAHNAMEGRIAALIDEKDVMLGAIGHDLKTPLAALRVRIESVENEQERARMASSIEDIVGTLDDILSLARVGRSSERIERTDVAALLASVIDEYEDLGKPVTLRAAPRMAMNLRATWLRRALRNLVDNALRYGERARIDLRKATRANGGEEVVISIEDDGPGIPEAEISAMLEPFARGEVSRNRSTGGAGLGLTLARAIAEQHGGHLALRNRMDTDGWPVGLIAELHLPLD